MNAYMHVSIYTHILVYGEQSSIHACIHARKNLYIHSIPVLSLTQYHNRHLHVLISPHYQDEEWLPATCVCSQCLLLKISMSKLTQWNQNSSFSLHTVEPLYSGHHRGDEILAIIEGPVAPPQVFCPK